METTTFTSPGEGNNSNLFSISVYVSSEEERNLVEDVLKQLPNNRIRHYSGLVTGFANDQIATAIKEKNLAIEYPAVDNRESFTKSTGEKRLTNSQLEFINAGNVSVDDTTQELPPNSEDERCYLLRFTEPLSHEVRQDLANEQVELLESRGNNSFVALLSAEQAEKLSGKEYVNVALDEPAKVSAGYAREWSRKKLQEGFHKEGSGEPGELYDIDLYKENELDKTLVEIQKIGQIAIEESSGKTIRARIPEDSVAMVRNVTGVRFISRYNPPQLYCNSPARLLSRITKTKKFDVEWDGKGIVVGVLDSGIDKSHKDLAAVVIKDAPMKGSSPQDEIGHGTHVAGIIAGNGSEVRGVAPGARLVNVSMVDTSGKLILPPDYAQLLGPAVAEGATILNLSWGTPIGGSYDEGSYKVDEFAWNHPEVLIVVAAGNSGKAPDGNHAFGNIGAPASAKNILTVGSAKTECELPNCPQRNLTLKISKYSKVFPKSPACDEKLCAPPIATAGTSSRGPTENDSIKPELLAPGMFIESTKASKYQPLMFDTNCITHGDEYIVCSGTSMATPFVSGCAAIVREFLQKSFGQQKYSAVLVKALLIAAADPIEQEEERKKKTGYPDFDQGYGLIDLMTILPHNESPAKRKVLFEDVFNNSPKALASRMPLDSPVKSMRIYTVNVIDGATSPLRIVLCWNDVPGRHVQNNLQLDVIGPDNVGVPGNAEHIYLKETLNNRVNMNGKPYDKINTVEAVTISNPKAGKYRIRVIAENTPKPNQGFALVFVGETDDDKFSESTA